MKRLSPDDPRYNKHSPEGPHGARIALGREAASGVAHGEKDGHAPGGKRWSWVERSDAPLPGTPAAPVDQAPTFGGMNHHLGQRIRETLEVCETFEEAVENALTTIPLELLHPAILQSAPVWNLGLGRRLAHLSPAALEVLHRLADETSDMGRLVEIAEGVTR